MNDFEKRIIEYAETNKPVNSIKKFLDANPDINDYLENLVKQEPWFQTKRIAFSCISVGIFSKVCCKTCGKEIDASKARHGREYCSAYCSNNNIDKQKKAEQSCIRKYGCVNAMENKEIQEKIKNTMKKRYGVEYSNQNEQIKKRQMNTMVNRYGGTATLNSEKLKNKVKNTVREKYGVDYYVETQEIKDKSKITCMNKYGTCSPMQCKQIQLKIKETNLKRFGVECVFSNKEIFKKARNTMLQKYGVEYPIQSTEIAEKIKASCKKKYGCEYAGSSVEITKKQRNTRLRKSYQKICKNWCGFVIPLFSEQDFNGFNSKTEYKWKCVNCGCEFNQHIHTTNLDERYKEIPRCPNCYPKHCSIPEQELLDFIKSIYNGEIVHNTRNVISPFELDIYIPEKKFAIEFDGIYWHSLNNKNKNYHKNKTTECEKKDIHLIHIFENEWINKKDLVKKIIKQFLSNNIYAIDSINEISVESFENFMKLNSLKEIHQCKHEKTFGFFANNKMTGAISIKILINKIIITDFAFVDVYNINNAIKLFIKTILNYNKNIYLLADARYYSYKQFNNIGFKIHSISKMHPHVIGFGKQRHIIYDCGIITFKLEA